MQVQGNADLVHDISRFLFREARYADDHRYEEWEALWADDGGGAASPRSSVPFRSASVIAGA